jgi:ferredoxin-NADP reductase
VIKEKQEVAKGTLFVTFDLLGEGVDFRAGQYFFVTLPDTGHQDDKGLRRHITIVTSPNEKGVLGLATRMRDSAFKRSLRELPVGTEVEVEAPKGDFTLPKETSRRRNRDHRLPQHAPLYPRGGAALSRDADLLEP